MAKSKKTTKKINCADKFFKYITFLGGSPFFAMVLLLFIGLNNQVVLELFSIYVVAMVIGTFLKLVFFKERPKPMKYKNIIQKIDASSFPSMHSARMNILLIVLVFHYPHMLLMVGLSVLAGIVCYSRIHLLKHDIVDVFSGVNLGIICASVMLYLIQAGILF